MPRSGKARKPSNQDLPGIFNPHNLPWFRGEKESWQAYEAFAAYRDIGKTRTLAKAADSVGKSIQMIQRWSRLQNWKVRAQQHDANEDQERMILMREHRTKIIIEHADEARDVRQQAVAKLLNTPIEQWSVSHAIRALKVSSELERLSVGASTANIAQSVDTGSRKIDTELAELEAILEENPEAANAGATILSLKRERSHGQRSDIR